MEPVRQLPDDMRLYFEATETSSGNWQARFTVHSHWSGDNRQLLRDETLPESFATKLKAESAADHAGRNWINAEYPLPN